MRRKLFIASLFSLTFFISFAQSTSKYIGVIKVDGIGTFSYQLNYVANKNNISGNTITNAATDLETTSALVGTVLNSNQISIKETKILKTAVKDKQTSFCYVNAILSRKRTLKIETLEGKFTGKDENGAICATGTIFLARKNAIMADTADVSSLIKKVQDTARKLADLNNNVKQLAVNDINTVELKNATVKIKFFDGKVIDNDRISVSYNGKVYLEDYSLTKDGKEIEVEILPQHQNILNIRALNIGDSGLNTVNIDFNAGGIKSSYIFNAEAKKEIKILLKRP